MPSAPPTESWRRGLTAYCLPADVTGSDLLSTSPPPSSLSALTPSSPSFLYSPLRLSFLFILYFPPLLYPLLFLSPPSSLPYSLPYPSLLPLPFSPPPSPLSTPLSFGCASHLCHCPGIGFIINAFHRAFPCLSWAFGRGRGKEHYFPIVWTLLLPFPIPLVHFLSLLFPFYSILFYPRALCSSSFFPAFLLRAVFPPFVLSGFLFLDQHFTLSLFFLFFPKGGDAIRG